MKNKIKSIFPTAINIIEDKYGFIDFYLPEFKNARIMLWDDKKTIIFHYTELIDKFRPSSAYLTCNINDKLDVLNFKKKLKWCKARPKDSFQECFNYEYNFYTNIEDSNKYIREKRNKENEELFTFFYNVDLFLNTYNNSCKYLNHHKNSYWSSDGGYWELHILINDILPTEISEDMYDYARSINLGLSIFEKEE